MSTAFPQRPRQPLSGPWRRAPDPRDRGAEEGWWKGLPDSAERMVGSPVLGGSENGACWLETEFSANEVIQACEAVRLLLREESGVLAEFPCRAWLNGNLLEGEPLGADGISFPLGPGTGLAPSSGRLQRLVLCLKASDSPERLPGALAVCLEGRGRFALEEVLLDPDPGRAGLDMECSFAPGGTSGPVRLSYAIASAGDPQKDILQGSLWADGAFFLPCPNAIPWTPGSPALYTLRLTVENRRGERDGAVVRFGMRSVDFDPAHLLWNGEACFFRAVVLRDFWRAGEIRPFLVGLKESGFNALWLEGGCPPPGWAKAADEVGVLLMLEPFPARRGPAKKGATAGAGGGTFREAEERCLASGRLQRSLANHPSIALWSLGLKDEWNVAAGSLARAVRRNDPSRPIVSGLSSPTVCRIFPKAGPVQFGRGWRFALPRPIDSALARELLTASPGQEVAWAVVGQPRTDISVPDADARFERWRAGFEALRLARAFERFERLLALGRRAEEAERHYALTLMERCPRLAGFVAEEMGEGPPEEAEVRLRLPRITRKPVFLAPRRVLPEGEDAEYALAVAGRGKKERERVFLALVAERGAAVLWRGSMTVEPGRTAARAVTIPGRVLLPGRYVLSASLEKRGGTAEERLSITVLGGKESCFRDAALLVEDPMLAQGLGFPKAGKRAIAPLVLTLGNSLLEHAPRALASVLARVEAGGTAIFLGTPGDAAAVLRKVGVIERAFVVTALSAVQSVPIHFSCPGELFDGLPSDRFLDAEWSELLPDCALEADFGRVHAGVFSAEGGTPWGATVLEVPAGKGYLVFTTHRWLSALGRDALAEAFLARLVQTFAPASPAAAPSRKRLEEIRHVLEEMRSQAREWEAIGPFLFEVPTAMDQGAQGATSKAGGAEVLPPALEAVFPPESDASQRARLVGRAGRVLHWRRFYTHDLDPSHGDTIVFSPLPWPMPDAAYYAATEVKADGAKNVPVKFASPHPFRIFVNRALAEEGPGGHDGTLFLPLRAGDNRILVKTLGALADPSAPPAWGFRMRFSG
ncbi:MAG: hypothetical protein V1918_08420 [Planctomycetota bacterium]